uniref:hypothetical protein n=1 Tax=Scytonema sp. PCC 10023 TaxID=1680591 RepID=UPI0039C66AA4
GFLAFFHLLGDAGKALISVFGNLTSWLGTGFLAFFHLLGDAGKALISAGKNLFNWLNDYPIIFVCFVSLSLFMIGVKYFNEKQKKEEEYQQAVLEMKQEYQQAVLKMQQEYQQASLEMQQENLEMQQENLKKDDIRKSRESRLNILIKVIDTFSNNM